MSDNGYCSGVSNSVYQYSYNVYQYTMFTSIVYRYTINAVERKRKKRMKKAGALEDTAENFESLVCTHLSLFYFLVIIL